MGEQSFLLFKPDKFCPIDIVYEYILTELKIRNLEIEKEDYHCLSAWHICNLWPRSFYDILTYQMRVELFTRHPIKILEVSGIGAIDKVMEIKNLVRLKYSNSIVRNCFHSPASVQEYNNQIKTIRSQDERINIEFKELPYLSYAKLTHDMCEELGKYIVDINVGTMIPYIKTFCKSPKKFRYYLIEDEAHSFTEYVCFICDYFQQYKFLDSVVLAIILVTYGEVCLTDEDDESVANKLLQYGLKHNLSVRLHQIVS